MDFLLCLACSGMYKGHQHARHVAHKDDTSQPPLLDVLLNIDSTRALYDIEQDGLYTASFLLPTHNTKQNE